MLLPARLASGVTRRVARGVARGVVAGGAGLDLYVNTAAELDTLLVANGIAPYNKAAIGIELGYASEYLLENAIYSGDTITKSAVLAAWANIAP